MNRFLNVNPYVLNVSFPTISLRPFTQWQPWIALHTQSKHSLQAFREFPITSLKARNNCVNTKPFWTGIVGSKPVMNGIVLTIMESLLSLYVVINRIIVIHLHPLCFTMLTVYQIISWIIKRKFSNATIIYKKCKRIINKANCTHSGLILRASDLNNITK